MRSRLDPEASSDDAYKVLWCRKYRSTSGSTLLSPPGRKVSEDLPAALRGRGTTSPTSTRWRHHLAGTYRSAPGSAAWLHL
eukprot:362507-Chlamydomonas_euryale.AAC.13